MEVNNNLVAGNEQRVENKQEDAQQVYNQAANAQTSTDAYEHSLASIRQLGEQKKKEAANTAQQPVQTTQATQGTPAAPSQAYEQSLANIRQLSDKYKAQKADAENIQQQKLNKLAEFGQKYGAQTTPTAPTQPQRKATVSVGLEDKFVDQADAGMLKAQAEEAEKAQKAAYEKELDGKMLEAYKDKDYFGKPVRGNDKERGKFTQFRAKGKDRYHTYRIYDNGTQEVYNSGDPESWGSKFQLEERHLPNGDVQQFNSDGEYVTFEALRKPPIYLGGGRTTTEQVVKNAGEEYLDNKDIVGVYNALGSSADGRDIAKRFEDKVYPYYEKYSALSQGQVKAELERQLNIFRNAKDEDAKYEAAIKYGRLLYEYQAKAIGFDSYDKAKSMPGEFDWKRAYISGDAETRRGIESQYNEFKQKGKNFAASYLNQTLKFGLNQAIAAYKRDVVEGKPQPANNYINKYCYTDIPEDFWGLYEEQLAARAGVTNLPMRELRDRDFERLSNQFKTATMTTVEDFQKAVDEYYQENSPVWWWIYNASRGSVAGEIAAGINRVTGWIPEDKWRILDAGSTHYNQNMGFGNSVGTSLFRIGLDMPAIVLSGGASTALVGGETAMLSAGKRILHNVLTFSMLGEANQLASDFARGEFSPLAAHASTILTGAASGACLGLGGEFARTIAATPSNRVLVGIDNLLKKDFSSYFAPAFNKVSGMGIEALAFSLPQFAEEIYSGEGLTAEKAVRILGENAFIVGGLKMKELHKGWKPQYDKADMAELRNAGYDKLADAIESDLFAHVEEVRDPDGKKHLQLALYGDETSGAKAEVERLIADQASNEKGVSWKTFQKVMNMCGRQMTPPIASRVESREIDGKHYVQMLDGAGRVIAQSKGFTDQKKLSDAMTDAEDKLAVQKAAQNFVTYSISREAVVQNEALARLAEKLNEGLDPWLKNEDGSYALDGNGERVVDPNSTGHTQATAMNYVNQLLDIPEAERTPEQKQTLKDYANLYKEVKEGLMTPQEVRDMVCGVYGVNPKQLEKVGKTRASKRNKTSKEVQAYETFIRVLGRGATDTSRRIGVASMKDGRVLDIYGMSEMGEESKYFYRDENGNMKMVSSQDVAEYTPKADDRTRLFETWDNKNNELAKQYAEQLTAEYNNLITTDLDFMVKDLESEYEMKKGTSEASEVAMRLQIANDVLNERKAQQEVEIEEEDIAARNDGLTDKEKAELVAQWGAENGVEYDAKYLMEHPIELGEIYERVKNGESTVKEEEAAPINEPEQTPEVSTPEPEQPKVELGQPTRQQKSLESEPTTEGGEFKPTTEVKKDLPPTEETKEQRIEKLLDTLNVKNEEKRAFLRELYENDEKAFNEDWEKYFGKEEPAKQEPELKVTPEPEPEPKPKEESKPSMPMKEEDGETVPDFDKATPTQIHEHLYNSGEYGEEMADKIVKNELEDAQKEVEEKAKALGEANATLAEKQALKPQTRPTTKTLKQYKQEEKQIAAEVEAAEKAAQAADKALYDALRNQTKWEHVRDEREKAVKPEEVVEEPKEPEAKVEPEVTKKPEEKVEQEQKPVAEQEPAKKPKAKKGKVDLDAVKKRAEKFADETPEERAEFNDSIRDMSDEELLAYMQEDGKNGYHNAHHPELWDEYDSRHTEEYVEEYDKAMRSILDSGISAEEAQKRLDSIKEGDPRYRTEERTKLSAEEEALTDFVQSPSAVEEWKKENNYVEPAETPTKPKKSTQKKKPKTEPRRPEVKEKDLESEKVFIQRAKELKKQLKKDGKTSDEDFVNAILGEMRKGTLRWSSPLYDEIEDVLGNFADKVIDANQAAKQINDAIKRADRRSKDAERRGKDAQFSLDEEGEDMFGESPSGEQQGESGFVDEQERNLWVSRDEKAADIMESIAKRLGLKIRNYNSKARSRGFISGDTIWVNTNSKSPLGFILGHEMGHDMENADTEAYNRFRELALEQARRNYRPTSKEDPQTFDEYVEALGDSYWDWFYNKARDEGKSREEAVKIADANSTKEKILAEIVADESGKILEDAKNAMALLNSEGDLTMRQKLKNFIVKAIDKVLSYLNAGNEEKYSIMPEFVKYTNLKNALNEAYKETLAQKQEMTEEQVKAAEDLDEGGFVTDNGDVGQFALEDVLEGKEREKAIKDLMRVTGRSEATVKKWLRAEQSLARVILSGDNRKFLDLQVDESVPSIWKNSDYPQGTVEFSNICRKRLPFTVIYQRLQEEFPNRVFDASTLEDIRRIMKENGEDVACGLCFVEDRRQLLGEIGQGFIDALKGERSGIGNQKPIEINENQRKAIYKLIESGDRYMPNLYELLTLDGMKKLRQEHPAVAQAFLEYNNARGMQAGRLFQAYSAYHRDILNWSDAKVRSVNDAGGLRIFSFSDFEAHHLIDLVQVLTDCAAKGVKVQGYTKVPEFAKAVKDTKMKVNRSLIAKGDEGYVDADYVPQEGEAVSPNVIDGKRLLLDTVEGIDVNHPDFFDATNNKNVGNILVGINDEHIRLAMQDPFVDYIIPFHSGLSESIRQKKGIGNWVNYKLFQLEKKYNDNGKLVNADKHGINIYTDVLPRGEELIGRPIRTARDFQQAFFKACAEKGWVPRFSKFINKNKKGEYVYTPGYEKMLIDFKLFDKNGRILEQEAVEPRFDNNFNKQILDKYVEGEESKVPYDELYGKIKEGLGLNGTKTRAEEIAEQYSLDINAGRSFTPEEREIEKDAKRNGTWKKAPNGGDSKLTDKQWVQFRTKNFKDWGGDWENDPENSSVVLDESTGEPLILYHGSPYGGIEIFDHTKGKSSGLKEFGSYFTTNRKAAELYMKGRELPDEVRKAIDDEISRLDAMADNVRNVREYDEIEERIKYLKDLKAGKVYEVVLKADNPKVFDAEGLDGWRGWHKLKQDVGYDIKSGTEAIEAISGNNPAAIMPDKYDAVVAKNLADIHSTGDVSGLVGDVYLVFDPKQIKSATDNNGNFSNEDARQQFSLEPGEKAQGGTFFSGGGLIESGLADVLDTRFGVEYDEKIAGVYKNNHGDHIVVADVRNVDPMEMAKKVNGPVQYFHASPVCKNASDLKMGEETELDRSTATSTAKAIGKMRPRIVTIENVAGYKDFDSFKIITDKLDELGYTHDVNVVNAADYGAATNRRRLILRAVADGYELPPLPEGKKSPTPWYERVKDLIPTLKETEMPKWMDERLQKVGIDWRNIDKPLFVNSSGNAAYGIAHAFGDEPAPTIAASRTGDKIVMPDGKVYAVNGRVLARLMGLPDNYQLPKGETLSKTVLGNGVPVELTKGVIEPLVREIADTAEKTQYSLDIKKRLKEKERDIRDFTENDESIMKSFRSLSKRIIKADPAELEKMVYEMTTLSNGMSVNRKYLYQELSKVATQLRNEISLKETGKMVYQPWEVEHRKDVSLDDLDKLFREYNTDEVNAELWNNVIKTSKKFGIDFVKFGDTPKVGDIESPSGVTSGGRIWLNGDYFNSSYFTNNRKCKTLLHELIHHATLHAFWHMEKGSQNLLTLKEQEACYAVYRVMQEIRKDSAFDMEYGRTAPHELIAELSNPKLREKLKKKNLWQTFVDGILRLFGFDTVGGEKIDAYTRVRESLDAILSAENYESYNDFAEVTREVVPTFAEGDGQTQFSLEPDAFKGDKEFADAAREYNDTMRLTERKGERKGEDYYPTPAPLALIASRILNGNGKDILDIGSGDGMLHKFIKDGNVTAVEKSPELAEQNRQNTGADVVDGDFLEMNDGKKYPRIILNPPYGNKGEGAYKHLNKAYDALDDNGRMVAILPMGKNADKLYNDFVSKVEADGNRVTTNVELPSCTFYKAGIHGSRTRMVVVDKGVQGETQNFDLSGIKTNQALYESIYKMNVGEDGKVSGVKEPVKAEPTQAQYSLEGLEGEDRREYVSRLREIYRDGIDVDERVRQLDEEFEQRKAVAAAMAGAPLPSTGFDSNSVMQIALDAQMKTINNTEASDKDRRQAIKNVTKNIRNICKALSKMKFGKLEEEVNLKLEELEQQHNNGEIGDEEYNRLKREYQSEIDPNTGVRMAVAAQRDSDRVTVSEIVGMARTMMESGLLDDLTRGKIKSIFSRIKNANGKTSVGVRKEVEELFDLMLDHQEKQTGKAITELLATPAARVNASGVKMIGKVDNKTKITLDSMSRNRGKSEEEMRAVISELISKDTTGMTERELDNHSREIEGAVMANRYAQAVTACRNNIVEANAELQRQKERYKNGEITISEYREIKSSLEDIIRNNKTEMVKGLWETEANLRELVNRGKSGAKTFFQKLVDRADKVRHWAYRDLEHVETATQRDKTTKEKFRNSGVHQFFVNSLYTFNTMLRELGKYATYGQGYLYDGFGRTWMENNGKEWKDNKNAYESLNTKAHELFGNLHAFGRGPELPMKAQWHNLIDILEKLPTINVDYRDGDTIKSHPLSQAKAAYIYAANKQADGAVKLRAMGISEADVERIKNELDPRVVQLMDWLQEDFLPSLYKGYSEVHERLFGVPMTMTENYFPLEIDKFSIPTTEEGKNTKAVNASTVTGGIKERKFNINPLDIWNTNVISLVAKHIEEMNHWKNFAEWNRDLNTLLNDARFKRKMQNVSSVYGAGDTFWKHFRDTALIASGDYIPEGSGSVDRTMLNAAKMVSAAKVSMRPFTATKQALSFLTFITQSNPKYFAKNLWNEQGTFKWCFENLPSFEKRWMSRRAGDARLQDTDLDWGWTRSKIVKWASKWGLTPNAAVDLWACAIGARSVYETRRDKYTKMGYSDEEAHQRAVQDAEIAMNETQQSSEKMFVAPVQVDRTWESVAQSVFRTASFGFTRRAVRGMKNLKQSFDFKRMQQNAEYMYKKMTDPEIGDGLTPIQAANNIKGLYKRQAIQGLLDICMYAFGAQAMWNIGGKLPYLLASDDDENRLELIKRELIHSGAAGFIEGLPYGNMLSDQISHIIDAIRDNSDFESAFKQYKEDSRKFNSELMPIISDLANIKRTLLSKEYLTGFTDLFNLAVQVGIGVNPQTFSDAFVAVLDRCGNDTELAKEALLMWYRIANVPKSQVENLMIEEIGMPAKDAKKLTVDDVAQRYVYFRKYSRAPYLWELYNDDKKKEVEGVYEDRFFEKLYASVDDPASYFELADLSGNRRDKFIKKGVDALVEQGIDELASAYNSAKAPDIKAALGKAYFKLLNPPKEIDKITQEVLDSYKQAGEEKTKLETAAKYLDSNGLMGYQKLDASTRSFYTNSDTLMAHVKSIYKDFKIEYNKEDEDGNKIPLGIDEVGWKIPAKDPEKRAQVLDILNKNEAHFTRAMRAYWRHHEVERLIDEIEKAKKVGNMTNYVKIEYENTKKIQQILRDEVSDHE